MPDACSTPSTRRRRCGRSARTPRTGCSGTSTSLDELAGRLRALGDDELEALTLLGERGKLKCSNGKQANWAGDAKDAAIKACAISSDAREAALVAITRPAISNVLGALVREVAAAAAQRRADGRVTFHDLLVHRPQPAPRRHRGAARARGPLPDPAARRVPGHRPAPDRRRPAHRGRPRARRRGDRLATRSSPVPARAVHRRRPEAVDLPVPARRHRAVRRGRWRRSPTTCSSSRESFRSRPGIIEWVNATLAHLMRDDASGLQVRVRRRCTRSGPPTPRSRCRSRASAARSPSWTSRSRTSAVARPTSSPQLARRVRDDGWRVQAPAGTPGAEPLGAGSDEWVRPARFSDVAVLLPDPHPARPSSSARSRPPTSRSASRASRCSSRPPSAATWSRSWARSTTRRTRSGSSPRCAPPRSGARTPISSTTARPVGAGRSSAPCPRSCPPTTRCSSAWPSCARSTSATSGRPRPRPSSGSCGSASLLDDRARAPAAARSLAPAALPHRRRARVHRRGRCEPAAASSSGSTSRGRRARG